MNRRSLPLVIIALALVALLASSLYALAESDNVVVHDIYIPFVRQSGARTVKIAVLGPSGDPLPGWRDTMVAATEMAIRDFPAPAGLNVVVDVYDSGCDMSQAETVAAQIVSDAQIAAVIGPACTSAVAGALPTLNGASIPVVSPSAGGDNLPSFGPTVFNRTAPSDSDFAETGYDSYCYVDCLDSMQEFYEDYRSYSGEEPNPGFECLAGYAYDAAAIVMSAIKQVATEDMHGGMGVDRAELATAVRATEGFQGVTGEISFDDSGNRIYDYWWDEFCTDTLNGLWSWLGEVPADWSLTDWPGYMRIYTAQSGLSENTLLREAPQGDFDARIHLLFKPVANFQMAGLLLFQDEANFMFLGRAFCNLSPPGCVGNGIYFDHVEGGEMVSSNCPMTTASTGEAYLRIVHESGTYTGYYSENGSEWTLICSKTTGSGVALTQIGISTANDMQAQRIPADFDYFEVRWAD